MMHGGEWPKGMLQPGTEDEAGLLDFSVNCNPFGVPECTQRALLRMMKQDHGAALIAYPDRVCGRLRELYAAKEGLLPEQILCTNGASEAIMLAVSALRPKKAVVLQPTFSGYERALRAQGTEVLPYPLLPEEDFAVTKKFLSFLREERPDVVFFCHPNNPTGRLIEEGLLHEILSVCEQSGSTLLLDECFLGMTAEQESCRRVLSLHPNLFVIDAFTKRYALAGLRLGFLMCADERVMNRARALQPEWAVSSVAQTAGCAILEDEETETYLTKTRELIREERKFLSEALRGMGYHVFPSEACFLLFQDLSEENVRTPYGRLTKTLADGNIRIRDCVSFAGLGAGYYRIAVRTHEENERLIRVLRGL